MDYIEGVSLKQFLKKAKLDTRLFLRIMVDISKGIAYAHQKGIIHRDLKPGNIMLDKNRQPYIMDFGIAKLIKVDKSLTKKGVILGTPQYMSPEQAIGEKVNHLSDIYALGAILYEMLAAKPMVQGGNLINIIYDVIHKEPLPLKKVNNKLSKDLEAICHKAIAKEMEKRYQSAEELGEDLKKFLCGEIIAAKTSSSWEKICKKIGNSKKIIVVVGVSFLLLLTVIWKSKNKQYLKVRQYIIKAKKWQQKAIKQKTPNKQLEMYMEASNLLEKALEASSQDFIIRKELIKVQKTMGLLAKKQKNFLLSFALFKRCADLKDKEAQQLLEKLEQQQSKLQKIHKSFILKIMQKVSKNKMPEVLLDRYVFTIVKMKKPYIIGILVPYLKVSSKNQRLLAIRALGKFGNTHTKFKGKDSVAWLLDKLSLFKSNATTKSNQKEVEEIIWALGWLKDKRANVPVYRLRKRIGKESLLWKKTVIPYKWIPLEKTLLKNPYEFVRRGNMKQEKGDIKGAMVDYNQAIALDPNFSETYNNRGFVYQYQKEYAKAIADYSTAIALTPKYAQAYNNRANAYQKIKEYAKALSDYSKAIRLNPRYSTAYNNRGLAYQKIKENLKAIADFTKAIVFNSKFLSAYNNRGTVYQNLKEYKNALADFNMAISLNPNYPVAYSNKANVYLDLKKYTKAIADYSTAISLNPKYLAAYNNRGNAYQYLKEYAKALTDYNSIIAIDPKFFSAYNSRGAVYQTRKEYTKALADFTKAIALDPKFVYAYRSRGAVYQAIKEYAKALADYSTAIVLNPKFAEAYFNRGNTYLDLKKYAKAIIDYSRAIVLGFKFAKVYYNRGTAYQYVKEHIKAIADFTTAIALDPQYSLAYHSRGNAYYYAKAHTKAIADFTTAIALDPGFTEVYVNRGSLYLRLKQYQKSYQDFQLFLKLAPNHSIAPKIRTITNNLRKNNLIK